MPKNRMRCAAIESSTCSIFGHNFGISQPFIMRFTCGLLHFVGDSIRFNVMCDSSLSIKYF